MSRSTHSTEEVRRKPAAYFVNRVANGIERRTANLEGEFLIDLKIYNTSDAHSDDSTDLWKKALLRIKLQIGEGTSHWQLLQKFVRSVDTVFEEEAVFYSDKINFK